jgi:hypothetical protein
MHRRGADMNALVARVLVRRATQSGANNSLVKRFTAAILRKKSEAMADALT